MSDGNQSDVQYLLLLLSMDGSEDQRKAYDVKGNGK